MKPSSNSEGSLKSRLKAETRRAILEAAEALLADKGLSGARMEDVAARAGVSVGTIYNHVGDRQALIDALLVAQRDELVGRIDAVLAGDAPFDEALEAFVRAVLAHFDAHLSLFRLLLEDELARRGSDGRRTALRLLRERVTKLVASGVERGVLRPDDAGLYPAMLMGMLRGILVQALMTGLDGPIAAAAPRVARFFLEGARSGAP